MTSLLFSFFVLKMKNFGFSSEEKSYLSKHFFWKATSLLQVSNLKSHISAFHSVETVCKLFANRNESWCEWIIIKYILCDWKWRVDKSLVTSAKVSFQIQRQNIPILKKRISVVFCFVPLKSCYSCHSDEKTYRNKQKNIRFAAKE